MQLMRLKSTFTSNCTIVEGEAVHSFQVMPQASTSSCLYTLASTMNDSRSIFSNFLYALNGTYLGMAHNNHRLEIKFSFLRTSFEYHLGSAGGLIAATSR